MEIMGFYEIPKQLDEKTLTKAKNELEEKDVKQIVNDIDYIRQWILKQTYMKSRTDDEFILAFLRTAKYSYARTQELIHNYWYNRTDMPDYFQNRNFDDDSVLMEIADLAYVMRLPMLDDEGRVVVLLRLGQWNPEKHDYDDMCKYSFICMDAICEDPRVQINGAVMLMDVSGFTTSHMTVMTPSRAQKITRAVQGNIPARIKAIHCYNCPKIFDAAYSIIKVFITDQFKKRITFHTSDISSVYKSIPKAILPTEYGGNAGTVAKINEAWINHILSRKKMLLEMQSYGVDMTKLPKKDSEASKINGTSGTFRKLNVD